MSLMSLKKQKGIEKLGNKSGLNLTGQEARPDTDCFELYCLTELEQFYEHNGFSSDVGGIRLMRFKNA